MSYPNEPPSWSISQKQAYKDLQQLIAQSYAIDGDLGKLKQFLIDHIDTAWCLEHGITMTALFLSLHDVLRYLAGLLTRESLLQLWGDLWDVADEINRANLYSKYTIQLVEEYFGVTLETKAISIETVDVCFLHRMMLRVA